VGRTRVLRPLTPAVSALTLRPQAEQVAKDPTWTLEKEMAKRRNVEYVPPAPKVGRCPRSPGTRDRPRPRRPAALLRRALPRPHCCCRSRRLAHLTPLRALHPPARQVEDPDHMRQEAEAMSVGVRCAVDPGERRGEVAFVGRVEGLPLGWWVGVRFDEPLGRGDGAVNGRRVFEAQPGYGGFVRPDKVKLGDFPPIDEFAEDDLGGDEI
jgi:hypothetical protein